MNLERGIAAVEFALIMPLLLLILFGIVEFGTLMFDRVIITNAAREGARWGSVQSISLAHPVTCSSGTDTINGVGSQNQTTSCGGSTSGVCGVALSYSQGSLVSYQAGASAPAVTVACNDNNPNNASLTVNVTYQFQGLGFSLLSFLLGTFNISSTSVMYYE